jgi:hypothetical protein
MERLKDLPAVGQIAQGLGKSHDFVFAEGFGMLFEELFDDPVVDCEAVSALPRLDRLEVLEVSARAGRCFGLRQLPGRKLATLTDAGQAYLHSRGETLPDPFAEFTTRCAGNSELRDALEELRYPVRQLARGDAQQVQAAQRVLTEARRSLYLILAEVPTTEEASQQ